MHELLPLKQVLLFTKLSKLWLFINEAIFELDSSKIKISKYNFIVKAL